MSPLYVYPLIVFMLFLSSAPSLFGWSLLSLCTGICSPRIVRSTLYTVPTTDEILSNCKVRLCVCMLLSLFVKHGPQSRKPCILKHLSIISALGLMPFIHLYFMVVDSFGPRGAAFCWPQRQQWCASCCRSWSRGPRAVPPLQSLPQPCGFMYFHWFKYLFIDIKRIGNGIFHFSYPLSLFLSLSFSLTHSLFLLSLLSSLAGCNFCGWWSKVPMQSL